MPSLSQSRRGLEPSGLPEPADRQCIKCHAVSGDNWTQCNGPCPVEGSPYYDPEMQVTPWKAEARHGQTHPWGGTGSQDDEIPF